MDYEDLVENNETPFFIFDRNRLESDYDHFRETASKHLDNYNIFFSVKTNSHGAVLEKLSKLGCGFEVASKKELEVVKDLSERIIYNGPYKEQFKEGIMYNLDSLSEMEEIQRNDIEKIGIRVSFEDDKFGVERKKIVEVFERVEEMGLNPVGISSHPGTQIKKMDEYRKYIEDLKAVAQELEDSGFEIEYIDVGGGFPDRYTRKSSQNELSDYFDTLKKMNDYKIYLEPGRAIVADSFELIIQVQHIKKKDGKKYAICDAGINLLPKITLSRYKFEKISQSKGENERYILAGPLLFGNDIIHKGWNGHLEEGDYLKVKNVGAYCLELAWRLSYDIPGVVGV